MRLSHSHGRKVSQAEVQRCHRATGTGWQSRKILTKVIRNFMLRVMKTRKTTAVVLPIPLFEEGEKLASHFGISRSELYSRAISSYISEYQKERTIGELNRIYGEEGKELDSEIIELQRQSLSKEKW